MLTKYEKNNEHLKLMEKIFKNFQLTPNNLALVGFSQGTMISIQVGIKNKEKIIGYLNKSLDHLKD